MIADIRAATAALRAYMRSLGHTLNVEVATTDTTGEAGERGVGIAAYCDACRESYGAYLPHLAPPGLSSRAVMLPNIPRCAREKIY
jgi:hypothetical protein